MVPSVRVVSTVVLVSSGQLDSATFAELNRVACNIVIDKSFDVGYGQQIDRDSVVTGGLATEEVGAFHADCDVVGVAFCAIVGSRIHKCSSVVVAGDAVAAPFIAVGAGGFEGHRLSTAHRVSRTGNDGHFRQCHNRNGVVGSRGTGDIIMLVFTCC